MDQRPRCKSCKYNTLRKKHRAKKLHDIGLGNDFFNRAPKALATIEKISWTS